MFDKMNLDGVTIRVTPREFLGQEAKYLALMADGQGIAILGKGRQVIAVFTKDTVTVGIAHAALHAGGRTHMGIMQQILADTNLEEHALV